MIKEELMKEGRPEDFEYLMRQVRPPEDITTYGAPGQYKGVKVAVVGAGIAGLAAAFELRKLGFDITIIEAEEERIGGRILTYYFDADRKLYGELGASRIPATHETAWYYINLWEFGTVHTFYATQKKRWMSYLIYSSISFSSYFLIIVWLNMNNPNGCPIFLQQ